MSVNMRIAVRVGFASAVSRGPRNFAAAFCRSAEASWQGCQVSQRSAHSAVRSACGSRRVAFRHSRDRLTDRSLQKLGWQKLGWQTLGWQTLGCKSPHVSCGAPVAYRINRNMGAFPAPCCLSNGEAGPRRLFLGTPPRGHCYNSNVNLSREGVF